MKLIVVISKFGKGGAERSLSVLSEEWIKTNEVKIIIFDGCDLAYSLSGDVINLKLPALEGIFLKIFQFFRRFIKLIKLFKIENPDLVISFMESANFPSILASSFTGNLKKLIISVRADPLMMLKTQRLLIPFLYRFPKKIITVSKGVGNSLIKMGIPEKKIRIIYNPLPSSMPSIFISLLKPNNTPKNYILGVGRLDKYKNFEKLIEAFSNLSDSNIHLVILGEGPERKKLENMILNKNLSDRIHLLGLVDDIWPWYRYAKCFVSSSLSESWGNVIVEAMSQGCPVVAFDCDFGPREIITDSLNGLLVKTNDVQSLSKAITTLIIDDQLRGKLSHNGLIRSSEFDAKTLSAEWLKYK
jgi:GalNAc-alpha-(1->4)-GalNAc-alpha-(1->3)-diNAcBac-PP-undecaprenol alpha-1,4-N-acetyl-D-galactosaminyltransferase